jgi:hypothetical protein
MDLKRLHYCQKMMQRYFTIIKFCLFSLGGGNLTILTEARSEIIKIFWQRFD